jgi:hypothetical protein
VTEKTSNPNEYSVYWPLLPVIVVLVAVNGLQLKGSLEQRAQLKIAQANLEGVLPQAQLINSTMLGLSKDVLALAETSEGARKIVQDFQIREVQPPPGAATAPVVTP